MPKPKTSLQVFRIDPEIRKQLLAFKATTGMPLQMQINLALRMWLLSQQQKQEKHS